jgi:hypothetical protein
VELQNEVARLNANMKEIAVERDAALDAPSQLRHQNEAMVQLELQTYKHLVLLCTFLAPSKS